MKAQDLFSVLFSGTSVQSRDPEVGQLSVPWRDVTQLVWAKISVTLGKVLNLCASVSKSGMQNDNSTRFMGLL